MCHAQLGIKDCWLPSRNTRGDSAKTLNGRLKESGSLKTPLSHKTNPRRIISLPKTLAEATLGQFLLLATYQLLSDEIGACGASGKGSGEPSWGQIRKDPGGFVRVCGPYCEVNEELQESDRTLFTVLKLMGLQIRK